MFGRRYSDGLHQAIEAKEHVEVARESKTLATITFQNYFRLYGKLSGMTGTALTEEEEFGEGIYKLDSSRFRRTARRPYHTTPCRYKPRRKYSAVIEEVEKMPRQGAARSGRHGVDREEREKLS